MKKLLAFTFFILCAAFNASQAQDLQFPREFQFHGGGGHGTNDEPKLHINKRWRECSFQLDPHLTQNSWREFTKEAGLVVSFRPLTDAKPMGVRKFEVSLLKWSTGIDERKDAWNDTFVHPDSSHWLVGGPRLAFPGITARMGITKKLDVGIYITKNPGANYGFYGAQVQYSLFNNDKLKWNTAVRGSFIKMYGPEDLDLNVYTAELVTSKEFVVNEKWLTLSPYAVVSTYLSASHEKSEVVNLKNERVVGIQGGVGVLAKIAFARLAVEYNQATVSTVSVKIGARF
jgi:hypothetical protein